MDVIQRRVDFAGAILFVVLFLYFIFKQDKTIFEWILTVLVFGALILDTVFSINMLSEITTLK